MQLGDQPFDPPARALDYRSVFRTQCEHHADTLGNDIENPELIVIAAVQDAGVAMVYSYQTARNIADGRLEILLSDYEIDPLPVSFIYTQGELVPQKVRAFIDFAMPRLREQLEIVAAQCAQ